MLKCIYPTQAAKLGVIAATYRSGIDSIFHTCPVTCNLLPDKTQGVTQLDHDYLTIERQSVPRKGISWSYTHFHHSLFEPNPTGTVLNISADTIDYALLTHTAGFPTVYAADHNDTQWPRRIENTRFIRCPAETFPKVTCQSCGGGKPLCARPQRDYIIVFVKHGAKKKAAAGGCYAATGNCLLNWERTRKGIGNTTWNEWNDPERLLSWSKALPEGTLLRHRISGDLGLPELPSKRIIPITPS